MDHPVQASEPRHYVGHQLRHSLRVGNVDTSPLRSRAQRHKSCKLCLNLGIRHTPASKDNRRPRRPSGNRLRHNPANTARAASHQPDLACLPWRRRIHLHRAFAPAAHEPRTVRSVTHPLGYKTRILLQRRSQRRRRHSRRRFHQLYRQPLAL